MSSLFHFVARTSRLGALLPRSLRLCSLQSLPEDLEEGSFLCPVLSLCASLERAKFAVSPASSLFVSPHSPSCQFQRMQGRFFYWR